MTEEELAANPLNFEVPARKPVVHMNPYILFDIHMKGITTQLTVNLASEYSMERRI
jgi:hypothetical protein